MAAADITVGQHWATIECDDTKHVVTVEDVNGSIANRGPNKVYLGMLFAAGNLNRDGAHRDGEIELEVGDSIPLPVGVGKFENQCLAGQTAVLLYMPHAR